MLITPDRGGAAEECAEGDLCHPRAVRTPELVERHVVTPATPAAATRAARAALDLPVIAPATPHRAKFTTAEQWDPAVGRVRPRGGVQPRSWWGEARWRGQSGGLRHLTQRRRTN